MRARAPLLCAPTMAVRLLRPRGVLPLRLSSASTAASAAAATAVMSVSHAGRRGTKNLDWYTNALAAAEEATTAVDVPVFPSETLHGRKRARAFIDIAFGGGGSGSSGGSGAASAPAAPASGSGAGSSPAGVSASSDAGAVSRVVVELADDIVPITVDNFLQVRGLVAPVACWPRVLGGGSTADSDAHPGGFGRALF